MRQFFKEILLNLYMYIGVRQVDKMSVEEVDFLLDGLTKMSKLYPYIPEESKKEIVINRLIKDKEFQNINVRLVSKWFDEDGKQFFQQECHKTNEQNENYKPLEGEEREAAIQKYLDAITKVNLNFSSATIKGAGERMRDHYEALAQIPLEDVERRERHKAYKLANYGDDGNALETWLPEDEWIKKTFESNNT